MIDLHGVSIAYDGTAVINGMSFNIAPGEIVALVGENGCGKSTLGRAICAAQLVDGGAVVVDGHDPSASELERLRVRELVINGMSFNIAPGEIVALVGENGCGKSTLGRAICAAQLVDGGAVVVDGHDPSASELERLRVRELVGYVRQDPLDQIV